METDGSSVDMDAEEEFLREMKKDSRVESQ